MTCIAAVVDKGTVYIGGDGRGMSGWDIYPQTEPKVFRISDMVFGHTGSLRVQQCAQYGLMGLVPRGTLSERVYMVTCVAETLRESLKIGGCLATKDGVESFGGGVAGRVSRQALRRLQRLQRDCVGAGCDGCRRWQRLRVGRLGGFRE